MTANAIAGAACWLLAVYLFYQALAEVWLRRACYALTLAILGAFFCIVGAYLC